MTKWNSQSVDINMTGSDRLRLKMLKLDVDVEKDASL